MSIKIGVLALQGAFNEHANVLRSLGVKSVEVRLPDQLERVDGLIIPGGESTTIGKLAAHYRLLEPLKRFAAAKPIWGTCAGMIFLAKTADTDQPILKVMDISVERNAFGRQVNSFETDLYVNVLENGDSRPFRAVFIRAPRIVAVKGRATVIAELADKTPVAAQEGNLLATSFHPELTTDGRFHQYFLELIKANT